MSGVYRGRAGPNVTAYLNNLNYEQEQFPSEELDFDDLAMFTNTNFTDFDIPSLPDNGPLNFDLEDGNSNGQVKYEDLLTNIESPDTFQPTSIDQSSAQSAPFFPNYTTPIQPAQPTSDFATNDSNIPLSLHSSTAAPAASSSRKSESSRSQSLAAEEESRMAAEEDKRRRNTAASARFRVKKKQREQALEKTVKEINDRNSQLETRISQLETENKWLKNLITEKNGNQSKEEMAAAFLKFRKESEERELKADE